MPLSTFVSHSGKSLELEVGPHARVEAVQQTLADLTGIPVGDQILMCEGARLDSAKPLAAYGLPGEERDKVHDLFLYSRAHLRHDAPLPPPEALPDCPVDLSGLDGIRRQRHRLDSAGSPLLRALPDYQRQFQGHLLEGNARHEASQQRMATCARLVSEQEVQALSIDAATSNVEVHYAYICDAYGAFMQRYQQQAAAHADVLSRFESDLQFLAGTELHPALRGSLSAASSTSSGCGGGGGGAGSGGGGVAASGSASVAQPASLVHLVNAGALREAAAAAARGHQHFAGKVAELESLFSMLKGDVEALFMQAPSVDLEALTRELEEMHGQVDEQASIVAALSSDLNKVQQLVEQAGEQLAADPAASVQVSDTVHMLETMHETHVAHLLPRVAACHTAVEAFAARCLDCKNALTRDVFSQLRTISSQQSKIREMKNKLALFREALTRQDGSIQELLVVRRVPAAYKQCLAECVRREAFMEKYAQSAAALAERMGTFREKELAMRESFRKHVERLIPSALLERMGLLEQPPHCQVSVSATEGERLLSVTLDDVRRIQLPWGVASVLGAAPGRPQQQLQQSAVQPGTPSAAASSAGVGSTSRDAAAGSQAEQQETGAAASSAAGPARGQEQDVTASLQLENAKLRAELASAIALDCIRSAQLASVTSLGAAAAAGQRSGSGVPSPAPQSPTMSVAGAGSSGTAAAAGQPAAEAAPQLPAEAAQRFEKALAAKDGLAAELEAQLAASREQAAAYEARIHSLEEQLAALAAAAEGRTSPLAAGAGATSAPAAAGPGSAAAPSLAAFPGPGSGPGSASAGAAAAAAAPAALPASPSGQSARREPAPDLAASADAAAGSSLSGPVHAPDVSRSMGHTSSASLSSSGQWRQQQQQGGAEEGQPGGGASRSAAVGEEPSAAGAGPVTPLGSGQPASPASSAAASVQQAGSEPAALSASGAAAEPEPAMPEDEGLAGSIGAAPEAFGSPAAVPEPSPPSGPAAPAEEAPTHASSSSAGAAGSEEEEAQAHAGQDEPPPAAAAAAPLPPPHPLLSSLMEMEEAGSDVEGVEPVSDSDADEPALAAAAAGGGAEAAAGFGSAGSGSPTAGYGSAQSEGEAEAAGSAAPAPRRRQ